MIFGRMVVLLLLLLLVPLAGAQNNKPEPPKPAPVQPVKVDEAFIKDYNDLVALNRLIETLKEQYGIAALERAQQEKMKAVQKWVADHKVQGYSYNQNTKEFTPPVPLVTKQPEAKK